MRQRSLLAALLVVVLGSCTPAEPAWPDGYRQAVCTATGHLRAAESQLGNAVAGVEAAETDLVAIAASGMERESHEADAALRSAPSWAPGSQLIAELAGATWDLARAADEFRLGARQGNGQALDRAVATAQEAEAALQRADLEADRLRRAIGWQPC